MCVNVKPVNNASIGEDLALENYINRAISNVRMLRKVPKETRVPLEGSILAKMNVIFYNVENFTFWQIFLMSVLFFFEQHKKKFVGKRQL